MSCYNPETWFQSILAPLSTRGGYIGRSAGRKLRRRYLLRAFRDFDQTLSEMGPGDLAFDFGANIGEFTLQMAKTGAEVHAYEPDPDIFEILRENLKAYPNAILHQKAVAQNSGMATLRRLAGYADNITGHSQSSSTFFDDARMVGGEKIEVEVVSFWELIANNRPAKLIKIDIEGSEFDILDHLFSLDTLPDLGKLFVETHEHLDWNSWVKVQEYRRLAAKMTKQYINPYWI